MNRLLPAFGAIFCLVALGWAAVWGLQLQIAHTVAGEPPRDMTVFWLTLAGLLASIAGLLLWSRSLSRLGASDVVARGPRPLLESEIQRLALKQLMRIESRL